MLGARSALISPKKYDEPTHRAFRYHIAMTPLSIRESMTRHCHSTHRDVVPIYSNHNSIWLVPQQPSLSEERRMRS